LNDGGDVPEWSRERSAKPRTRVRFPSSPPPSPGAPDDRAALDRLSAALDRFLRVFLIGAAIVVFVAAVMIIATMESSAASQGGRLYLAIVAIVILAGIDGCYGWLEQRRRPFSMEGPGEHAYRRYLYVSLGLLLLAAAALIGLALILD
jgi:hypothetical protein